MRAGRGGVTWPAVPNTEYRQCSVTDSEADTERERLLSAGKVTERERPREAGCTRHRRVAHRPNGKDAQTRQEFGFTT